MFLLTFKESYFNLLVSLYLVELQLVVKCDWAVHGCRSDGGLNKLTESRDEALFFATFHYLSNKITACTYYSTSISQSHESKRLWHARSCYCDEGPLCREPVTVAIPVSTVARRYCSTGSYVANWSVNCKWFTLEF